MDTHNIASSSDKYAWLDAVMGLNRLAAVAFGAFKSNGCPVGYTRIESEAACVSAAASVGKTWKYRESKSDRPKGCFFCDNIFHLGVYFNTHSTGSGDGSSQPLCAGGAPVPAQSLRICSTLRCICSRLPVSLVCCLRSRVLLCFLLCFCQYLLYSSSWAFSCTPSLLSILIPPPPPPPPPPPAPQYGGERYYAMRSATAPP